VFRVTLHPNQENDLDKILSDYRRPLGEFEIVDFKTDDPIEQLREQLDVDIDVNLHWTWSYGSEMEEMRRIVKDAPTELMEEMEDWAFGILETLNADQQLEMLRTIGPKYDIDPEAVVAMTTTLPNFAELNSPIYMHTVVPNLRKLGLITDRTEDQWRRVGMICDA
jgi:hypothetical protein